MPSGRVRADGKFCFRRGEKLYLRGVTYGTFGPGPDGDGFGDHERTALDFALMADSGINAVRTYTVPPTRVLDEAARHGLDVLVGLPWEQHVAFLEGRARARSIVARVREGVRACAGHPAVLGYAVGNEIPAPIVRWHGRRPVERFIERLYDAAKDEDPDALVTYVNFPSTEYLELPFLDLYAANVYLEDPERLAAYLARLQVLAGDKPLVLAEVGLDSRRNGPTAQAAQLRWQLRSVFDAGAAGAFVFAWTDEWHRGGHDIEDWDFGLTDRARRPKPALAAVREVFDEVPFPSDRVWPRVSVVVCSYNGARTLEATCEALRALDYPDYEVIVVDDGSTDATATIARASGHRVVSTPNRGLSSARDTGWQAADGELVAYLDDDARPDVHWLRYLAHAFVAGDHAAVGGPNVPPADQTTVAACVAASPGGPVHVLLTDDTAEHVPGCNLAVRRSALEEIGGFDHRFRVAGDDVDLCWRILDRGWTIGFSAGATVWHERRSGVRSYLRQQCGYGRAEAILERKWPEKYNAPGHARWSGRIYGPVLHGVLERRRWRVYYGPRGSAPFQRLYRPAPGALGAVPLLPEWWLLVALSAGLTALGLVWPPLRPAALLLAAAVAVTIVEALLQTSRGWTGHHLRAGPRVLTASLHVLQPLARLKGRLGEGLTPWRRGVLGPHRLPRVTTLELWSETWRSPEAWAAEVEHVLRARGAVTWPGGASDRWDLEVRGGLVGSARLLTAVEEHGGGRQLVRFRIRPRAAGVALVLGAAGTALAVAALLDGSWIALGVVSALTLMLGAFVAGESGSATALLTQGCHATRAPDVR